MPAENINFFTPVHFEKPTNIKDALLEKVDNYFYFSGRKAVVLSDKTGTTGRIVTLEKPPLQSLLTRMVWNPIRIASFFTGVIPLLMLTLKAALRWNNQFHTVTELTKKTPKEQEVSVLPKTVSQEQEIFIFGDVHGELVGFQENLVNAGVIDKTTKNWTGGTKRIIQMGDVIDRGPLSKEVYNYLTNIQEQAHQAGGQVIRLIGNHELMFLENDYHYADIPNPQELTKQMVQDIKDKKIQLAYSDGTRLYLHAGLRSGIREQLIKEIQEKKKDSTPVSVKEIANYLNELLVKAVETSDFTHKIFQVGVSRGGSEPEGGVLWADVLEILNSIHARDIPQVIAHNPPHSKVENPIRITDSMRLINVDAGLCKVYGGYNAYVQIAGDEVNVIQKTAAVWKKQQQSDKLRQI